MLTQLLKEQTRAQHEQLENVLPLPQTRDEYVRQLTGFYGFVEPWELKLATVLPPEDLIVAGRKKTAWLEEDLEFFGIDAAARAALPRANLLPSTDSREHLLGAAYVMEGSTLGGQFISRHLETSLGLQNGAGYRYHRSYGADTGAQWQAFRAELLRCSSPATDPIIIDAARTTFALLHQWFRSRV